MNGAGGRVAITPRGLSIDGRTRLLYGGEVQYYRVRDPRGDPAATHRLWAEALDRVVECGMNLVTAYAPWDVHEPAPGRFTFEGEADLPAFLAMCRARDLAVVLKPGPFINSEWPDGLGSFGAVPAWFAAAHPDAMARRPGGGLFSVDLLGRARGAQPSLFAPALLEATARWFAALAPIVRRFVHDEPTVFALQLDNETNFYFSDRYAVDHAPPALAHWRAFLRARYGTVEALNAAWGARWPSFEEAPAPRGRAPAGAPPATNRWHQDWWDAGQAGIEAFQRALRGLWEGLGVREPDVLFVTNDSPHSFPFRDLSPWDPQVKNAAGLAMLDAYPKQFPTSGARPLDYPFLTGYFSRRFARSNDAYALAGAPPVAAGKCYGAELEGGLFGLPLLNVPLPVPPAATDHVLLQHLGRGSALAAVYVLRGGLNRDGTPYFANAALGVDGRPGPRWEVLRRWGRALALAGDDLLASVDLDAAGPGEGPGGAAGEALGRGVAVAVDSRVTAPAVGLARMPLDVQAVDAPGAFGWLEDAGLEPDVLDLRDLAPAAGDEAGPGGADGAARAARALAGLRLIVWANADATCEAAARALDAWVRRGGTLVTLAHRGRFDLGWRRGTAVEALLADGLFGDGAPLGTSQAGLLGGPSVELCAPGGPAGPLRTGPSQTRYRLAGDAAPLARARPSLGGQLLGGRRGDVVAWAARRGEGRAVCFGASPAFLHAGARWYDAPADELLRARALARWLAAEAGARAPVASVADARATCWSRRVPGGGAFVFVGGRLGRPGPARVELHDLAALGLAPEAQVTVTELLGGEDLGRRPAAALGRDGVDLQLGAWGTAVLRLVPAP